ncbi:MAG: hypothetical protein LQ344_000799 [Seirophora lacunosa]|nr:MAG: hypothetical protein LQ344_000799 [Seirophora lacunosa]
MSSRAASPHDPPQQPSMASFDSPSNPLISLLHNSLILSYTVAYLPTLSIVSLASTSQSLYSLVYELHPRTVFRRLDLHSASPLPHADLECFSKHKFNVLRTKRLLSLVTTLILDSVVDLRFATLRDILLDDSYNVRILSIRRKPDLNFDASFMVILRYLIWHSRPDRTPKLKGLYYFTRPSQLERYQLPSSRETPTDAPRYTHLPEGVTTTPGSYLGRSTITAHASEDTPTWTSGYGSLFQRNGPSSLICASTMEACQGLIAFDAILCHHGPGSKDCPLVANISLGPEGCQICHSAPEKPLVFGQSPSHELPLLTPPPLFASTVKAAQTLSPGENPTFYARCDICMRERWCASCNAWWCENCYTPLSHRPASAPQTDIKVHMGLCVQKCLVGELYSGAGEGGMWG